jgi:hypothetical protein
MANELPTRRCDGCGQIWSSGRFLDPTAKTACGFCGDSLPHRRRLPDAVTVAVDLELVSERATAPAMVAAASSNGASAHVAPLS